MFWIILFFLIGYKSARVLYPFFAKRRIRRQVRELADNTLELSPRAFFKLRNKSFGGPGRPHAANRYNFAGVYILHNKTKNIYYVGQAKRILDRVNNHFTGKGNGDVYADYKYGDVWTIRMIALSKSNCATLNELERKAIDTYHAYTRGYNRTRGNQH